MHAITVHTIMTLLLFVYACHPGNGGFSGAHAFSYTCTFIEHATHIYLFTMHARIAICIRGMPAGNVECLSLCYLLSRAPNCVCVHVRVYYVHYNMPKTS